VVQEEKIGDMGGHSKQKLEISICTTVTCETSNIIKVEAVTPTHNISKHACKKLHVKNVLSVSTMNTLAVFSLTRPKLEPRLCHKRVTALRSQASSNLHTCTSIIKAASNNRRRRGSVP
jgi:hypothetical protein